MFHRGTLTSEEKLRGEAQALQSEDCRIYVYASVLTFCYEISNGARTGCGTHGCTASLALQQRHKPFGRDFLKIPRRSRYRKSRRPYCNEVAPRNQPTAALDVNGPNAARGTARPGPGARGARRYVRPGHPRRPVNWTLSSAAPSRWQCRGSPRPKGRARAP
jgi:hypothetical protein